MDINEQVDNYAKELSDVLDDYMVEIYKQEIGESPYMTFMGEPTKILTNKANEILPTWKIHYPEKYPKPSFDSETKFTSISFNLCDIRIENEKGEVLKLCSET